MIARMTTPAWMALLLAALLSLGACGQEEGENAGKSEEAAAAYERGPHRGRLLRSDDFAVEITIFEQGVKPHFRVFPFLDDKPLPPAEVQLEMSLTRLGGGVDGFAFKPENDYLLGQGVVREPHSFDVLVRATYDGKTHEWRYASYEGRTTISQAQADAGGILVEPAGPATLEETVALSGRMAFAPQARAEVKAWYPGRIVSMSKAAGEAVKRGEPLASILSSESLQTYSLPAPISGIVVERNANVGDVAGAVPVFVIADTTRLHADLFAYPRDTERLRTGQPIVVRNLAGDRTVRSVIKSILPTADVLTQTVEVKVDIPNPEGVWRPGQAVEAKAIVGTRSAPLAVRTKALQRFRDFTVVLARVGEVYEVRMLELGLRTPEWTEVLSGLEPGEIYVSENAFLVRADIEKSAASHDH